MLRAILGAALGGLLGFWTTVLASWVLLPSQSSSDAMGLLFLGLLGCGPWAAAGAVAGGTGAVVRAIEGLGRCAGPAGGASRQTTYRRRQSDPAAPSGRAGCLKGKAGPLRRALTDRRPPEWAGAPAGGPVPPPGWPGPGRLGGQANS
jgi:hypothetical protein